ncbi:hypothetical protein THAOC_05588, partial [Thalassiosira oceanica]
MQGSRRRRRTDFGAAAPPDPGARRERADRGHADADDDADGVYSSENNADDEGVRGEPGRGVMRKRSPAVGLARTIPRPAAGNRDSSLTAHRGRREWRGRPRVFRGNEEFPDEERGDFSREADGDVSPQEITQIGCRKRSPEA